MISWMISWMRHQLATVCSLAQTLCKNYLLTKLTQNVTLDFGTHLAVLQLLTPICALCAGPWQVQYCHGNCRHVQYEFQLQYQNILSTVLEYCKPPRMISRSTLDLLIRSNSCLFRLYRLMQSSRNGVGRNRRKAKGWYLKVMQQQVRRRFMVAAC